MKSCRIPILVGCLALFFVSLWWLSDVLVSSERESAKQAWRARLDGIAAMVTADLDGKMADILQIETDKALYEYVAPGVLEGGGIDSAQGVLAVQKPDFIRGYALIDFAGNIQTPEADASWISPWKTNKNRVQSIANKINTTVKYENLTRIKEYDSRLAVRMMEGVKIEPEQDGWGRLHSPDKGFAFVKDGEVLWAVVQVSNGKELFAEGIAFDWEKLRQYLLEGKEMLLPGVALEPGALQGIEKGGFGLASIPAHLTYGAGDDFHFASQMGNYLKWSLALIWIVAVLASSVLVWLVAAMARLEKKQFDFVSTVTHELRTPLTSMLLHAEMLEDGAVPEEKKKTYYATLTRECRRLERLIENILSYSRLQRGKALLRKDSLTASELFDPLAKRIEERLEMAGFSFSYAMARQAGVQLLATDILSVEQIMDNLAANAVKYALRPEPDASPAEVILTVQLSPRELVVRFRDNGPGIPRNMRRKVFEPFGRMHSGKPGVGLGLALSRDMARSLGGDLTLEAGNLDGGGACFKLTLPLGPAV